MEFRLDSPSLSLQYGYHLDSAMCLLSLNQLDVSCHFVGLVDDFVHVSRDIG